MSQPANYSVARTGPSTPTEMFGRVDDSFAALLSSHLGATRPTYAEAGTRWVSTATANKLKYYEFDGVADHLIKTIDIISGQVTYADVDGRVVYASKTGSYTATANDNNAVHRYTAAATVSLTAAATLGSAWHYTIVADGGAVTIDPNGSELINGLATNTIPQGGTVSIICDGTGFYTYAKPAMWEPVGAPVNLAGLSLQDWKDLGSYRALRMRLQFKPSIACAPFFRYSTDNGLTFDSVSGNYVNMDWVQNGTTQTPQAAAANTSFIPVSGNLQTNFAKFEVNFSEFNQASYVVGSSEGVYFLNSGSAFVHEFSASYYSVQAARNALRLSLTPAATFTSGFAILEGVRG